MCFYVFEEIIRPSRNLSCSTQGYTTQKKAFSTSLTPSITQSKFVKKSVAWSTTSKRTFIHVSHTLGWFSSSSTNSPRTNSPQNFRHCEISLKFMRLTLCRLLWLPTWSSSSHQPRSRKSWQSLASWQSSFQRANRAQSRQHHLKCQCQRRPCSHSP